MCREARREKIRLGVSTECHAECRHVLLRVVDTAVRNSRRIDVHGQSVRFNDPAHHGIAQERLVDVKRWILQFCNWVRCSGVQKIFAETSVFLDVPPELFGAEKTIKSGELLHLGIGQRRSVFPAEFYRLHRGTLRVRNSKKRDGSIELPAQVREGGTKAHLEKRILLPIRE